MRVGEGVGLSGQYVQHIKFFRTFTLAFLNIPGGTGKNFPCNRNEISARDEKATILRPRCRDFLAQRFNTQPGLSFAI